MKMYHHSEKNCHPCFFVSVMMVVLAILAGCSRPLPENEAKKYLRAVDNELIILSQKIGDARSYQAMRKLFSLQNAPLPFLFSTSRSTEGNCPQFEFDAVKGIYQYDTTRCTFVRTSASDSIIIDFPFQSEVDTMARFVITRYSEEWTALEMMYPTCFNAYLQIGNRVLLTLQHEGEIDHGVPVNGNLKLDFSGFTLEANLRTKLFRSYGKVKIDLSLSSDSKEIMKWNTKSRITFAGDGRLVYENLEIEAEMFPVRVKIEVDNHSMDPRTKNFMDDFNYHSEIRVSTLNHDWLIGNVKLIEIPRSDKLNFAIVYNDQSWQLLEEFLLSARKLLNYKL